MTYRARQMRERGAATVELAISMLIIIPVFLYVLFLDDLLKFRLDQQEATVTTLWDYTALNYDKAPPKEGTSSQNPGNLTAVQKYARNTYCDHEGGTDSDGTKLVEETRPDGSKFQTYTDCSASGSDHHRGSLSSHACWLGLGEQITCSEVDKSVGVVSAANNYAQEYQQGGYWECHAKLEVLNNLIPEKFLQSHSKQDLSKHNFQGSGGEDAHANGEGATGDQAYVFEPTKFSLLTDPWAINQVEAIKPGDYSSGKDNLRLQNRAQFIFDKNPLGFAYKGMAYMYVAGGVTNQIMIVNPNDLLKANVSHSGMAPTQSIKQEGSSRTYFNSAWQDWSGNKVQGTYNARGKYYMGCTSEGTGC